PIRLGIANISRLPIMLSMARSRAMRMASGEWRVEDLRFSLSLFATPYSLFAIRHSRLHQRAIVETAVEPVLIARDILLHPDVDEGLVQRDARHLGEGDIDKAFHVGIVFRLVADGSRATRAVDQSVHFRRLVAHGVEDGIVAVIAPV